MAVHYKMTALAIWKTLWFKEKDFVVWSWIYDCFELCLKIQVWPHSLDCKNQSIYAAQGYNCCLFSVLYKTYKYVLCAECRIVDC